MKVRAKSLAAALVLAALIIGIQLVNPRERAFLGGCGLVDAAVWQEIQTNGQTDVIISLQWPDEPLGDPELYDLQAWTAQKQAAVLKDVPEPDFTVSSQYETVPALAGPLTADGASTLDCHPDVLSVDAEFPVELYLGESVPLIGAADAHAAGVLGQGVDVAVLDTGIDSDHADLADDIIGGRCYLPGDALYPCPAFPAFPAEDDHFVGHGTHVSGIISSGGVLAAEGVAPDVNIFAYKVFSALGETSWEVILKAINDILTNQQGQFAAINMSFGGGHFTPEQQPDCDGAVEGLTRALRLLRVQGTLPFAASGNNGSSTGLGYPACLEEVVAVGATYDSPLSGPTSCNPTTDADQVACFSNSSAMLDLLAPGVDTLSDFPCNPGEPAELCTEPLSGTSMASPHAVGVAALLKSIMPGLTPDEVEDVLKRTGVEVQDTRNGLIKSRIDARAAVLDDDFDLDGCINGKEIGANAALGGLRNPDWFWDFMDQYTGAPLARDRTIAISDIGAVVSRFGTSGNPLGDPLKRRQPPRATTRSLTETAPSRAAIPGT
ncbi:MAG: S8 family serine peptidase [Dehalococcoidia bacterium]